MSQEVLNQGKKLRFNGFKPTYEVLPSYAHLIDASNGKTKFLTKGGLNKTIDVVSSVIRNNFHEVEALAKHLHSANKAQACFNIWHWVKTNIKYGFDTVGKEEIRTPSRTYADRHRRADCEDMAIISACLLINMGYKPTLEIVAFNGNKKYQHIYTICENITLDSVLNVFNEKPKNITKKMNIELLSGLNNNAALGAVNESLQNALLDEQSRIFDEIRVNGQTASLSRELRQVRFLLSLAGTDVQDEMAFLIKHVYDVTEDGDLIFLNKESEDAFMADTVKIHAILDREGRDIEAAAMKGLLSDEMVEGLEGLSGLKIGAFISRNIKSIGNDIKNVSKKVGDAARQLSLRNVGNFLKKFNPVSVAARNAYLGLLRLNFRGFATKLYYVMSPSAGRSAGNDYATMMRKRTEVSDKWKKFGGSTSSLTRAVYSGRSKKPLFGAKGLGAEPAMTTALLTAATPVIIAMGALLKGVKMKGDVKATPTGNKDLDAALNLATSAVNSVNTINKSGVFNTSKPSPSVLNRSKPNNKMNNFRTYTPVRSTPSKPISVASKPAVITAQKPEPKKAGLGVLGMIVLGGIGFGLIKSQSKPKRRK